MTEDKRDINFDDERSLDSLIKAAGSETPEGTVRPAQDVIDAYLLGTASKAEKELIRGAMLQSKEFRQEMRAITADLDFLGSPEAKKKFDDFRVEQLPNFVPLVDEHQTVGASKGRSRSWQARIISLLTVPRLAGVAAAVLLIAVSSMVYVNRGPSFEKCDLKLESRQVDSGLLSSTEVRGESTWGAKAVFDTALEAALSVLRKSIEFKNGNPTILSVGKQNGSIDNTLMLRLTERDGSSKDFVTGPSGPDPNTSVKDVQFWVLTVPDLSLYSLKLSENSKHAKALLSMDSDVVVVCTWSTPAGFSAARAITY